MRLNSSNATPSGAPSSDGGMSPLSKAALGLAATFGGGYALGYFFGPLPTLADVQKALGFGPGERAKYDGEVRSTDSLTGH